MTRRLISAFFLSCASAGVLNAQESRRDSVVFDFIDAELRTVLMSLARAGELNLVFSSIPQRNATLVTNQPVARDQIRSLLISIAESNGMRVSEDGPVMRLDVPPPPPPPAIPQRGPAQLYVYPLKHADAPAIAATLQSIYGGTGPQQTGGLSRSSLSSELRSQQIPPTAALPAPAPDSRTDTQRTIPGTVAGAIHIVPDAATNSLVVRASQEDWEIVRQAIQAMDLRPLQVVIEVLVAEVRRTSEFDLGVTVGMPRQPADNGRFEVQGDLTGTASGDIVLKAFGLGGVRADVVLAAIASSGNVNILSRPVITAMNNEEARLLIGSQRPFIQVFRALPTDAAVRDQVVQYRDVGTALTIRPTINGDGYVTLNLIQEVSTATNEVQFGAPIISTREAATKLIVRDSQTVVIGGLIDRQVERTRSGIPWLKDIPVLGALFGSSKNQNIQAEMFVFLTPYVIRSDEDSERIRRDVQNATPLLRDPLPNRVLRPDTIRSK